MDSFRAPGHVWAHCLSSAQSTISSSLAHAGSTLGGSQVPGPAQTPRRHPTLVSPDYRGGDINTYTSLHQTIKIQGIICWILILKSTVLFIKCLILVFQQALLLSSPLLFWAHISKCQTNFFSRGSKKSVGGSGTCKALILRESLLNSSQQQPIVGNLNNLGSDLSTADIHGGIHEDKKLFHLNGSDWPNF